MLRPPNAPISPVQRAHSNTQTASIGTRLFILSESAPDSGAVIATNKADRDSANAKRASVPPASCVTHSGKKKVRMLAENIVSEKSYSIHEGVDSLSRKVRSRTATCALGLSSDSFVKSRFQSSLSWHASLHGQGRLKVLVQLYS